MSQWIQNNMTLVTYVALSSVLAVLILNVIVLLKIRNLNKRARSFFSGKKAKDLEGIITNHNKEIKELDKEVQELFDISNRIHNLATNSLHKIGVIRFNPFKDIGGDQSFAIALLDGKNSGIIISSLHTREGTRIYTKPIIQGASKKYPLTEEEKQAIKIASPMKINKI